ncbi:MAG: ExeA family protein [Anaerovoracaceae bacterium]
MNYTGRYGLEMNPFIKNGKDVLVETGEYREIVFRLDYLLQTKGFGLITGEPGRGKTTAVRKWAEKLNPSAYKVVYISLSTVTVIEFYRQLAEKLGIDPFYKKVDNFKAIQGMIERYRREKRITPVIILDEANYMKSGILNDLKILFNFEMDSRDYAVVLLVGLPQLNNQLRLSVHEPLRQRLVTSYNMEGLNEKESEQYIYDKLKGCGCHQEVFDKNALHAIINASNGTPRIINQICNKALLIGEKKGKMIIDMETVMDAVNDNELG